MQALRDYDPDFGITTDIIVGFPGESEADFKDTLDIVDKAFFGKTHVFRYSPRRGTAGAKLKDAVPEAVKKERAAQLEEAADETARAFRASLGGKEAEVLIEEEEDGYLTGYTGNYIKVYIGMQAAEPGSEAAAAADPAPGEICKVKLGDLFREGVSAFCISKV